MAFLIIVFLYKKLIHYKSHHHDVYIDDLKEYQNGKLLNIYKYKFISETLFILELLYNRKTKKFINTNNNNIKPTSKVDDNVINKINISNNSKKKIYL